MAGEQDHRQHWLDLFTEETWLELARDGFRVSGFSESRWTTVQRIQSGDLLICYLTGVSRYVGVLKVTGPAFHDVTPIWKSQVFPSRVPVSVELALMPAAGVPVRSLSDQLSYFQNMSHPLSNAWTGHFRGSPAQINDLDAAVILSALNKAASNPTNLLDLSRIVLPAGKRPRRKQRLSAPQETIAVTPTELADRGRPISPSLRTITKHEEDIPRRLCETSISSDDGSAFEIALTEAFASLGFRAERRSGSGDTDVVVVAPLGEEAYAAVVDGKANRQGRVGNAQIDWYALERHREKNSADHILVVAPGFSGGELTRDAERSQASLLTASDLAEIVRLHTRTPFSLPDLRDLFRYPGKPDLPLTRMREHSLEIERLQRLLPDIIEAISEAYRYELFDPVNADSLMLPLAQRRRGRAYSREEINAGLDLLCVPQLGALRSVGERRYSLQMPKETLIRRVRALASVLSVSDEEHDVSRDTDSRGPAQRSTS